mgnify:CR=1 FL=1
MPAPQYRLAFCEGYEAEVEKYYDYGTVSPMIYNKGEHLLNLLEFFRKYPDPKVHIDDYVNYCQMFYDYTEILESDYFQNNTAMAEELVMQILVSILKGDQNYHYENIAFVCDEDDKILRLAPMIDHEFSRISCSQTACRGRCTGSNSLRGPFRGMKCSGGNLTI